MKRFLIVLGVFVSIFALILMMIGFLELMADEEYELIAAIKDMTIVLTIVGLLFAGLFSNNNHKTIK